MPRSFSELEKDIIRKKLIDGCKVNWAKYGYKKCSVDVLCENAGISKGAFYLFFPSKEQLFYETLKVVQQNLYNLVEEILLVKQSKYGVAEALRAVYTEYAKSPFLYNTSSADFTSFLNKLSDEERQNIFGSSLTGAREMLNKHFLTLRISEEKALSVFSALLHILEGKDKMVSDHNEVFDFMLDNLIDKIFE